MEKTKRKIGEFVSVVKLSHLNADLDDLVIMAQGSKEFNLISRSRRARIMNTIKQIKCLTKTVKKAVKKNLIPLKT